MLQETKSTKVAKQTSKIQEKKSFEARKYASGHIFYHCKKDFVEYCGCKGKALMKGLHTLDVNQPPENYLEHCKGQATCELCKKCK